MATPDLTEVRAAIADIIADARRTDEVVRRLQAFVTTGALEQTPLDSPVSEAPVKKLSRCIAPT